MNESGELTRSAEIDKLCAAIVAARKDMGAVPKSGYNKFQGYRYSNMNDFDDATQPMHKHGLTLAASVLMCESLGERTTRKGHVEYAYEVTIRTTVIHESGQHVSFDSIGHGQDSGDKGVYKAITGARKYAIASIFGLATTDDPEEARKDEEPPTATRADDAPAPPLSPKQKLAHILQEWGGIHKDDMRSAIVAVARKCDVKTSTPMTNDECAVLVTAIESERAKAAEANLELSFNEFVRPDNADV